MAKSQAEVGAKVVVASLNEEGLDEAVH